MRKIRSTVQDFYDSDSLFSDHLDTAEDRAESSFEEAFVKRSKAGFKKFGMAYRWTDGDQDLLEEILSRGSLQVDY